MLPDFSAAAAVLDVVEMARIDRIVFGTVQSLSTHRLVSSSNSSGATSAATCCRVPSR